MINSVDVPTHLNAATVFVDANAQAGRQNKVAIYYNNEQITYGQVLRDVNRTGNAFKRLGLDLEQRVFLLLLDCPEFVYTFFGAMKIGAVPVPTNTNLKPHDYAHMLNDSRAKILVVNEELLPLVEPIKGELKFVTHTVVVGKAQPGHLAFSDLIASERDELTPADTSKDDVAFWLWSSGSTGPSKGAVHLHHDMLYCADLYARNILGIDERDIAYSVAKLYFAYGLGNALYFPFRVGGSAVLFPGRFEPRKAFEIIQRYRPTLFFAAPTAYAAMLAVEGAERAFDLASVRLCVSAGENLPAAIYERWKQKFGIDILDGIGSTEALHIYLSNRVGRIKPGSSGELVPGYEAKIVDEEGRPVRAGEIGDLWVKGESIATYYWNQHERTKRSFVGEWFLSGDKYVRDEDGIFWYRGRSDDMLKVGGQWVSPVEVEAALIQHPAVLESGVVGTKDQDELVKPLAFVVLKPGQVSSAALAKELQEFVKGKIAAYKYPRWIEFVSELPKTATGKIQRFKLRAAETAKTRS